MTANNNSPDTGKNDSGPDYRRLAHEFGGELLIDVAAKHGYYTPTIGEAVCDFSTSEPDSERVNSEVKNFVRDYGRGVVRFREQSKRILDPMGYWPGKETYLDHAWVLVDALAQWEGSDRPPEEPAAIARELVERLEETNPWDHGATWGELTEEQKAEIMERERKEGEADE